MTKEKWTVIKSTIDEMWNDATKYLRSNILLYGVHLIAYRIPLFICIVLEVFSLRDVIVEGGPM